MVIWHLKIKADDRLHCIPPADSWIPDCSSSLADSDKWKDERKTEKEEDAGKKDLDVVEMYKVRNFKVKIATLIGQWFLEFSSSLVLEYCIEILVSLTPILTLVHDKLLSQYI